MQMKAPTFLTSREYSYSITHLGYTVFFRLLCSDQPLEVLPRHVFIHRADVIIKSSTNQRALPQTRASEERMLSKRYFAWPIRQKCTTLSFILLIFGIIQHDLSIKSPIPGHIVEQSWDHCFKNLMEGCGDEIVRIDSNKHCVYRGLFHDLLKS